MEPVFLSLAEIIEIHQDQVTRYGGSPGVRDFELLRSAAGMPSATYGGEFLHTDLFEMAAAYLFHLVKNHPFVDGNKRVGAVAALVFLLLNGCEVEAPEEAFANLVLAVARGELAKAEVAVFFRRWAAKAG